MALSKSEFKRLKKAIQQHGTAAGMPPEKGELPSTQTKKLRTSFVDFLKQSTK